MKKSGHKTNFGEFARKITELRLAKRLRKKDMDRVAGVSASSMQKFENENRIPGVTTIAKLAEAFSNDTEQVPTLMNELQRLAKKQLRQSKRPKSSGDASNQSSFASGPSMWTRFDTPPSSVKIMRDSEQYYPVLTEMVISSRVRQPLFVSVGTADFVSSWITRIAAEKLEPIWVSTLFIFREKDDLMLVSEKEGVLRRGSLQELKGNINRMKNDANLRRRRIIVTERYWPGRSPFHGYLYGKRVLIGRWEQDSDGCRHVKTPLHDSDASTTPDMFTYVQGVFNGSLRA